MLQKALRHNINVVCYVAKKRSNALSRPNFFNICERVFDVYTDIC